MIKISNCPITGLRRRIISKNFYWFEDVQKIIIECKISHYKPNGIDENGEEILELVENMRIKSYMVPLIASDSLVNPTNGAILTDGEVNSYHQRMREIALYPSLLAQYQIDLNEYNNVLAIYNQQPVGSPPVAPILPIEPEEPSFHPISEYNFYVFVLGAQPIQLPNTILGIIALRDAQGKFNR